MTSASFSRHRVGARAAVGLVLLSSVACRSSRSVAPEGPPAAEAVPAATSQPPADAAPPAQALPAAPEAAAPASPPTASAPPLDCEAHEKQIEATLKAATSCRSDGDCTTLLPGCPFGCTRAIQRSVNLETIEREIASYKASCNECVYRCRPASNPPTCRAGFCSLD